MVSLSCVPACVCVRSPAVRVSRGPGVRGTVARQQHAQQPHGHGARSYLPNLKKRHLIKPTKFSLGSMATPDEGVEEDGGLEDFVSKAHNPPQHVMTVPDFLDTAADLRGLYDKRFEDPRETHPERFLWDYWHVPEQYTLMRTPAHVFFPEDMYQQLEDALLEYGQEVLGCRSLTHVWLSYYIDGCEQQLHADVPHGPWAFTLSLTDWANRKFKGGETMMLQPHVLNYWQEFDADSCYEYNNIMRTIPQEFNQLLVFDPRIPHGVRRVEGTKDPREARIVLHGWFAEPVPFFRGGLEPEDCAEALDQALDGLFDQLESVATALGTLTVRVHVSGESGLVESVTLLTDGLVVPPSVRMEAAEVREEILYIVYTNLKPAQFPTAAEDSFITIPFVFQ